MFTSQTWHSFHTQFIIVRCYVLLIRNSFFHSVVSVFYFTTSSTVKTLHFYTVLTDDCTTLWIMGIRIQQEKLQKKHKQRWQMEFFLYFYASCKYLLKLLLFSFLYIHCSMVHSQRVWYHHYILIYDDEYDHSNGNEC